MQEARANPDELLKQVKAEEQRQRRGKLKIFFGAAAGVGKTYAMLEAARARKAEGLDILVGIVETHGRAETEALLQGLEVLPPHFVEYRGTKLREFDLDAALARKPGLILVDELAHTNAPGSRHAKRWEDTRELLEAGINVYTTLNVQHLESLNDVVQQVTGVIVRETVPDSVVEQADEIELIDLPPDDLIRRLKEGKIYVPEQAGFAADNFFRKGNLYALRELALRSTADRVNLQGRDYREEQAISRVWRTSERLLACVSPSPFSAQLVRSARRMAAGLHAEWIAITVEPPNLSEAGKEALAENLSLAEQLGAETVRVTGTDVVKEVVAYARKHNVTKIIAGKPGPLRIRDRLRGSFVGNLIRASGDIDVYIIKGEPEPVEMTRAMRVEAPIEWRRYAWAALTVFVCTLLAWAMRKRFDPSNLVMVYLLGVALIAARIGSGPAILCSILSVVAFDFAFAKVYFSVTAGDIQHLVSLGVMLAVALIISSLTSRLHVQAEDAGERERRTAALYSMSGQLASNWGTAKLLDVVVRHVAEVLQSEVAALVPDETGRMVVRAGNDTAFPMAARERGVAHWVFDVGRVAGLGTDTMPGAECLYVPLNGTRGPVGVLAVRPLHAGRPLTPDLLQLLEAFGTQGGMAVESDRFADEARKAQLEVEVEKSRNALLNSVSHDLRTPLSAITGAASTLLEHDEPITPSARRELAETISEEAAHLSRLVTNLLEMTRLESGAAKVKKEPCPIEEVVGSALTRMEKQLSGHPVTTHIPAELPLVPLDVVLTEHVFINLLENAAKYTPAGSPIEISATASDQQVTVEIADRGPGISPGDEKKIFEKFYRGKLAGSASGVGLGLTICRAIVEAHGGKIWAENRPGGGASFRFTLPLAT